MVFRAPIACRQVGSRERSCRSARRKRLVSWRSVPLRYRGKRRNMKKACRRKVPYFRKNYYRFIWQAAGELRGQLPILLGDHRDPPRVSPADFEAANCLTGNLTDCDQMFHNDASK